MDFHEYSDAVRAWTTEVIRNCGVDAERTIKSCNELIACGVQTGDSKLLGFAYFYAGETYYCLNDHENFIDCISKAVTYLENAREWDLLAKSYNYLGIMASNRQNALVALDYYLNAVNYCRKYHMHKQENIVNANIGSLNLYCKRYAEAQIYLEKVVCEMTKEEMDERYHTFMLCIYSNLIQCYTGQGNYDQVELTRARIYKEHWKYADELDKLSVWCSEARYYHAIKDMEKRNACIDLIQQHTTDRLMMLDIFDDLCEYCNMLLETDKEDAFWSMIDIVDPIVKHSNMSSMQLRVISLKVQYYRIHKQSAEYLQEAGLYFELSKLQEKEMQSMMNSVLAMRKNLEMANRKKQEMELQNKRLLEKSQRDALTGLANRYRFNEFSEEAFSRACLNRTNLTFEILDIDYFKEYNDNYGHQKGDECLVQVSSAIKRLADRHGAFCSRYGGDEFVLIYENITGDQAAAYAEELKQNIIDLNMEHRFSKAYPIVTISQGLCSDVPSADNRIWDYMHSADAMLYLVKKQSRNHYMVGALRDSCQERTGTK